MYMGIQKEGIVYERKVYDLLNLFGNVGGLIEFMDFLCLAIVSLLCTGMIEAKSVSIFWKSHFSGGEEKIGDEKHTDTNNVLMGIPF